MATTFHTITYELANNVARITANRPRYRNAQSRRLLEELDEAFRRAAEDKQVHVIALFGAGEHFSGGHDLGTPTNKRIANSARCRQACAAVSITP